MVEEVDDILFTMTKEMADMLIEYNNLKREITINEELIKNIASNSKLYYMFYQSNSKKKKRLEDLKKQFIKEFKKNNREEIEEYILINDKKENN
jgi:diphthamide biosynthesis methyltransferase